MAEVMSEVKKQIVTMITAAFGFVAALQWNEAIKKIMDPIIAGKTGITEYIEVAVLVTIIAVVVTYIVGRLLK